MEGYWAFIILSLVLMVWGTKKGIKVEQKGDQINIKMGDRELSEEKGSKLAPVKVLKCDPFSGCQHQYLMDRLRNPQAPRGKREVEDLVMKTFSNPREMVATIEELYYKGKIVPMEEGLLTLALARTLYAAMGGRGEVDNLDTTVMEEAVADVHNVNTIDTRIVGVEIFHQAARLANLQAKLLLMKDTRREKLFEQIGEYFFLEGKLMFAREALSISLRYEMNLGSKLSLISKPATVIKKIISKAIEYEYLSSGECPKNEGDICDQAAGDGFMMQETKLNQIFWGDLTRSIVHEKLEWWTSHASRMNFANLERGILGAGVQSGIYLSLLQRPISALPNLRSQPVWGEKETGMKRALDKIRENWKVIRDEGLELMEKKGHLWSVDPGFSGMSGSRGWWGEVTIKGVALHSSAEQTKLCQKALFTCRLIQQFPEASGCPSCKATFSLVRPGTRIPPHAGPTNTRLRAHLGLVVPKGGLDKLNIRVGNQTVGWKLGKWTIIDDSFEHEIINDSGEARLILLVDFRHPDIRPEHREEFNWNKKDMRERGLARAETIRGGFPL